MVQRRVHGHFDRAVPVAVPHLDVLVARRHSSTRPSGSSRTRSGHHRAVDDGLAKPPRGLDQTLVGAGDRVAREQHAGRHRLDEHLHHDAHARRRAALLRRGTPAPIRSAPTPRPGAPRPEAAAFLTLSFVACCPAKLASAESSPTADDRTASRASGTCADPSSASTAAASPAAARSTNAAPSAAPGGTGSPARSAAPRLTALPPNAGS